MVREPTVLERVQWYWQFESMFRTAAPVDVVAAVSGGADSVAMLRLLLETLPGRIVVAHLNHGLRGAESDADEDFVRGLAARVRREYRNRLTLRAERREITTSRRREGPEGTARRVRYEWLASVAEGEGIGFIATGHNADDQAETILHNIIRGTSIRGLAGIGQTRALVPGIILVRPILDVTRCEILEYLRGLGQDYREDSSNVDLRFTRNRIRHEILPMLEQRFNPRVKEALCRLAAAANTFEHVLAATASDVIALSELPRAGDRVVFDLEKLGECRPFQLRDMWRRVWEREGWPRRDLDYEHLDRLVAICRSELAAADFPGNIRARRRGRVIQIGPVPASDRRRNQR